MKHFADLAFFRRLAANSLFFLSLSLGYTQDLALGAWRAHFSYSSAQILTSTGDKLFCATANGLFSYTTATGEVRRLSKVDGLSDAGATAMAYGSSENVLAIGYASGNIDLIYETEIVQIRDLSRTNLTGSKSINQFAFEGNLLYTATDLGVVVIDLVQSEIIENYIQIGTGGMSVSIHEIVALDEHILIRTNEGLQIGAVSDNLLDFSKWQRFSGTMAYTSLAVYSGAFYALNNEELYILDDDSWVDTGADLPTSSSRLFLIDDRMFATDNTSVFEFVSNDFIAVAPIRRVSQVNDLALVNSTFYIADSERGLVDEIGNSLSPSGPEMDIFSDLQPVNNQLYAFYAPSVLTYDGSQETPYFSVLENGHWRRDSISSFPNVSAVALANGTTVFSSIGHGLYVTSDQEIIRDIPGSLAGEDLIIPSIATRGGTLWLSAYDNIQPLHVQNTTGEWSSLSQGIFGTRFITDLNISSSGLLWLTTSAGQLFVWDPSEEQLVEAEGLPGSVTDVSIGDADEVWITTDKGPALYANASFVLFDNIATRPAFENRLLFENEEVNAVLIDGGSRVWLGTNQGLWAYNESITERVAQFNMANSPLPSNTILDLAYNEKTGEIFIATDKGMVSYRSASSRGGRTHQQVSVFPNPVRPDYQGQVGLKGLVRNAQVKVTDINGHLVKELRANGGTASWDLSRIDGGTLSTGIYFFFSSSADGEETYVGKIAVIR